MRLPCVIAQSLTSEGSEEINLSDLVTDIGSLQTCSGVVADVNAWLHTVAKVIGDAAAVTGAGGICTACYTVPQPPLIINPVAAIDPNDKVGMVGMNELNYIKGDVAIPYTIYFENQPNATAPANQVFISDTIDTNTLNLASLQFIGFGFGDSLRLFAQPIAAPTFSQDVEPPTRAEHHCARSGNGRL